ncbi:hypothetical protein hmeg3_15420 [Herbaspirillum sp. meg3]|uniref:Membrane-bound lysozyme inhibitor of c-type lysozyme MliC n=1 Tax=Herbaspirillum rhizosphaerae TaxID=346179 RepID=A0ABW8Z7M2_9BURK|nr:hypothetical protein [Herbaspirillum sp. meg3]ASU39537.1 hypothetical protein hmeg3_15420 [Herbaspirillum sp. meg3]
MTFLQRASVLTLSILLAACASENVPLTETKPVPAPLQPVAAAVNPAWAGRLATGTFSCEMGNKVEVKVDASNNVNLVWKGSTYKMTPVSTSTGALRFEDKGDGLVWIQIPSKSMLLNSKIGQQLANDCKNR